MKPYDSLKKLRELFFDGKITQQELCVRVQGIIDRLEDKNEHNEACISLARGIMKAPGGPRALLVEVTSGYLVRGTSLAVDVARALEAAGIHVDIYQEGQRVINLKK